MSPVSEWPPYLKFGKLSAILYQICFLSLYIVLLPMLMIHSFDPLVVFHGYVHVLFTGNSIIFIVFWIRLNLPCLQTQTFYTWHMLFMKLSTEFFNMNYWAFYFKTFNVIFLYFSLFTEFFFFHTLNFSSYFTQPFLIHSGVYAVFGFLEQFYNSTPLNYLRFPVAVFDETGYCGYFWRSWDGFIFFFFHVSGVPALELVHLEGFV